MRKSMRKTVLSLVFLSVSLVATAQNDTPSLNEIKGNVGTTPRAADIPEGSKGAQGGISVGAARDSVVAPTFNRRLTSTAQFDAGLGYACGTFDPFDNIEQSLNRVAESWKKLPQQYLLAFEAYIASLPAYLLNKINPTLYNTLTKNLDEAFALFEAEYKSCAQIERETQLGDNPHGQLVRASIAKNLTIILGTDGITIDQAMEQVRAEGAKEGVRLENGTAYGGDGQEPVNVRKSLMIAGSNLLMGRNSSSSSSFGDNDVNPMADAFESPEDMFMFVRDIYGESLYDLLNSSNTSSGAGIGYQHKYVMERNKQIDLLRQFMRDEITRQEYQELSRSQIAPEYLKEIRRMAPTQQDIAIDAYARDIAIKHILEKMDFVILAVTAGLREPNIAASEAFQVIQDEAGRLLIAVQNDIAHLNNARYL